MKVLMIIERYIPIWGGAENQMRQLIPNLIDLGINVEIVTRRWDKELPQDEIIDDIAVYRLGHPGKGIYSTTIFTIHLLIYLVFKCKSVDIFHTHGAAALGAIGSLAAKITRKKNVAKIATAGRIPKLRQNIFGYLILNLFKQSNAIICISNEIREELRQIGTEEECIYRVPNGVDGGRFKPIPNSKHIEMRVSMGLPKSSNLIVFSGRLVPRKGLDVILEAWTEIYKNCNNAYLIIFGSGKDQSDSIEEELNQKLSNKYFKNILFMGETNDLENYLGISDVFVFPSRKEGFPNALLEAMASGLAVVASDIGGVSDLIQHEKTGLLFKCGNSTDLSEKVISLINDKSKSKKIGNCAHLEVINKYSFKYVANKYNSVYISL